MTRCPRHSQTRIAPLLLAGVVAAAALLATVSAATRSQEPAPPQAAAGDGTVPGEVLVKFRENVGRADIARIAREADTDRRRPVGGAGAHLLRSRRLTAREFASQLSRRPDVVFAEPNFIIRALAPPSDPRFPQLWGLQNVGQAVNGGQPGTAGADIGAVAAWDVSTGSAATVVAVIDTGIDYTHPDLAPNVWSAPAPFTVMIGDTPITCAAGTHGFNAITKTCDPMDDHDHGTHVAGTIGAAGNNDIGVAGINWTTSIMGAKFLGADGSGTLADVIDAIEFVIQTKAAFAQTGGADVRVLSNSWGATEFSQALLDEVNRANGSDLLFVAAAGNDGLPNEWFPTYPASFDAPNVIAVAATDNTDQLASFSNYGDSTVHLAAPGVDILSTTTGGTYSFFSGTSMATPHVSGAAALILSKCSLDTAELKREILDTVDRVASLAGLTITGGRLNVNSAVRGCSTVPGTPFGLAAAAGDGKVTLSWTAVAGARSYNVKRSLVAGGPYATVASSATATYVDTAVNNDVAYYYVVSAVNGLGESADSAEATATPKRPADLVISALTVPASSGAGEAIVVTDTTRNQAAGIAAPSTTRFYFSTNMALDAGDILLDGSRPVPSLGGGVSSAGSTSVTLPSALTAGTYYVIAKADADGVVGETSETNNTAARVISIGPDLVVSALQVPPTVAAGSAVPVADTTKNQGAGLAGPSVTRFYLSTNAVLDAADTLLDGSRAIPALAGGASSAGSTTVTLPSTLAAATYYVIAKADADAAVRETSEANNTTARAVSLGPDLAVSALQVPSTAAPGSLVSVSDTTKNQGAALAGPSVMRFYLSANGALDAADTLLDGSRAVPALAGGASSAGSTAVMLPAGLTAGTYYVIAKADADLIVEETSEANNTAARAVSLGPDLVVSALQVPPALAAGSLVAITDTTKNQGGGPTGPSTTRFYLSTNTTLDAADLLLDGSRAIPALAGGASSAGSTSVTLPSDLQPGTRYVIAKADADGAVGETSEANNTAARAVSIGPDLVVSAFQVPSTVTAGSIVSVTDTTRNQAAGVAGPSTTRFYLSANIALDAADILLDGSRAIPALAGGASSAGSTSVTIPAGLPPGTYYLIAKADGDNTVAESAESNNTGARAFQVAASPAAVLAVRENVTSEMNAVRTDSGA